MTKQEALNLISVQMERMEDYGQLQVFIKRHGGQITSIDTNYTSTMKFTEKDPNVVAVSNILTLFKAATASSESIGRKTTHAGQTTVTITSTHAKAPVIQAAMQELTRFLKELINSAEQLDVSGRIKLIAQRAFSKLLASLPPLPTPKLLPATG